MRYYVLLAIMVGGLLPVVLQPIASTAQTPNSEGKPEQVILLPGQEPHLASGSDYLSPPTEAAHPFTHLLLRYEASIPVDAELLMYVRASIDGSSWSDWGETQLNDDLWMDSDGPDVHWSEAVEVGAVARYWQVRGVFRPAADGALPELRQIDVNTVDVTTFQPPAADAVAEPPAVASAVARPSVVSRTNWGCPDGQGSRANPAYSPVTHMVIHHTADSNSLYPGQSDWASRVRAIWSFHTHTRGWGDIGYNYLIDPNGVIYEGRAGGDNAVGFHDTANYGSMGVSVMGTYTSVIPTPASQESLVRLMAWKASQRGIDPLGASYYHGCAISRYCNPHTTGARVANIAGHRQVTPGHTTCPGDAFMALMPGLRNQVKQILDGAPNANIEATLLDVHFDRTTVAGGELLKVTFVVKNTGAVPISTQAPQASTTAAGEYNDGRNGRSNDAYVYDEGECFLGNGTQSYASFDKENSRFRVTLGPTDANGIACAGDMGSYPWRWGLNGDLAPGETREIVGYVRFRNEGASNRTLLLRAGLIQEYVRYFAENVKPTTITITPERVSPVVAAYDSAINTVAHVYRLGETPSNFLARTANALSIQRSDYVGSFPWDGAFIDWGDGGPLGLSDNFVVVQTRAFRAPVDGIYTFRTISDDGSWLWVNGQQVVLNHGLHPLKEATGMIYLNAGIHSMSFKYFEGTGYAAAGYDVKLPNTDVFVTPLDASGTSVLRFGSTFTETPDLTLAADDLGGTGVAQIRWSWDGANWQTTSGALVRIGKLQNGNYRLRYQAIDRAGNQSAMHELAFGVNTNLTVYRAYIPVVAR